MVPNANARKDGNAKSAANTTVTADANAIPTKETDLVLKAVEPFQKMTKPKKMTLKVNMMTLKVIMMNLKVNQVKKVMNTKKEKNNNERLSCLIFPQELSNRLT